MVEITISVGRFPYQYSNRQLPHYHIGFKLPKRLNEILFQKIVNPRFLNGLVSLTLNCVCITLGFLFGIIFKLSRTQAVSISIERSIQNGTRALRIRCTLLTVPEMTIVPVTYYLLMFVTFFKFCFLERIVVLH